MESAWLRYKGRKIPASLRLRPVFQGFFGPGDRVLDLGCGYGRTCRELYQKGMERYFGLDLNLSGLKEARQWMAREFPEKPRPHFQAGDGGRLPFADCSFDGLIMQAFLTTLVREEERRRVASEAARVLVPGGRVYVADYGQNTDNPLYRRRYREGLALGLESGAFQVKDPDSGEVLFLARHYEDQELKDLFQEAGFSIAHHSTRPFVTFRGNRVKGQLLVGLKNGASLYSKCQKY